MPPVKLEVFPLPDVREIGDRVWFKLKLDDKGKWKPARWQPAALDDHIQTVLKDESLSTSQDRVKRLCEITSEDAMSFLAALEAVRDRAKAAYDRAREYLTNAPSAVDTPVRQAMRARGWCDVPLSSTLFETTAASPPPAPESPQDNG
jgi:hypothetical protein